ncbi:glycosyltransferase [Kineothrix sp. MSJ-39]|uniref:glycosyltransferase n=1 Tax=Kineothrix sp. MSJ-39 TaxID=2841533 RepID=UPI001C118712|nr:glycosyltransferase [Kineothrix sp. MSJ-39]MBU5430216.1 glycosyltransferase [Kineothrix sp. MSJ-39]
MENCVVQINLGNFGSTGNIAKKIKQVGEESGLNVILAYPDNKNNTTPNKDDIIICSEFVNKINQKMAYYSGLNGCFSWFSTLCLINRLDHLNPGVIHLHNLHDSYINFPLLFRYIKRKHISVVWTLHDCWAFTGKCPNFTVAQCDRWKSGCGNCKQLIDYPSSRFDVTKKIWKIKRKYFLGVNSMQLITPSKWLESLVKESFLSEYPVETIYNGIDESVFKPIRSKFREKMGINENKTVILGVSYCWNEKKGIDIFFELSKRLDKSKYQIVMVGLDNSIIRCPEEVIAVSRTNDLNELAEIYSAADIFVNATREEVLGMVNIEALACGTPVITFKSGGSPECIDDSCGIIVKSNTIHELIECIEKMTNSDQYSTENCLKRAEQFQGKDTFQKYINIYKRML